MKTSLAPAGATGASALSVAERLRAVVNGAVQGVGFRPYVYRLARELSLDGWVLNTAEGLIVEVEGSADRLEAFRRRFPLELPVNAAIRHLEWSLIPGLGKPGFEIRSSDQEGRRTVLVLPDLAVCPDCAAEILDARNRRHLYPFTNCTACGPRFSIIEGLPYDRSRTTMRRFTMCRACQAEYEDPSNRRFHAQPNACPACGPQLEWWDRAGHALERREGALFQAARALERGAIVAVKGLGGFHLMVDARNDAAVRELRHRKHRDEKPFAVMFPDLASVQAACEVSEAERRLLQSPASPIVLLRRRAAGGGSRVAPAVAPKNPLLGALLPTTPLHALLLRELGFPAVATSGNLSEEPICIDEHDALDRLGGIADFFLVHDRPIARAMDDSVVRVVLDRPLVLRAGRGYAPIAVPFDGPSVPVLAVGGHMKNTVAVTAGDSIFISQHVGDLDSLASSQAFVRAEESLRDLYAVTPSVVARDLHPDYRSTQWAEGLESPRLAVQHHHAHIVSCMADNGLAGPVLGAAWDGSGYGTDGTIWGGEFLRATRRSFDRLGFFRPFSLPGGDVAVREPRRSALGLLYEIFPERFPDGLVALVPSAFSKTELGLITSMLRLGVNAPVTTSVGRLFDAVASLAGVRQISSYEGQAAMALEFLVDPYRPAEAYPVVLRKRPDGFVIDWEPMIREIIADRHRGLPVSRIATRFHHGLVEALVAAAIAAGQPRVVLGGGCFQNAYLLDRAVRRLRAQGFEVFWPCHVPPNDGGLSLGQAVIAAERRGGV